MIIPWYTILLIILYWIDLFTNVFFTIFLWSTLVEIITKVMLVPILITIITIYVPLKNNEFALYIVALIFCLLGDILLELNPDWTFYAGLGAFLVAHIFFISAHLANHKNYKSSGVIASVIIAILLSIGALVGVIFLDVVWIAIAVAVYVFALCFMTGTAWLIHPISFIGGLFFVTSDLFIGLRTFFIHNELCWLNGLIMFFYGICLFFLVWGIILHIWKYHYCEIKL